MGLANRRLLKLLGGSYGSTYDPPLLGYDGRYLCLRERLMRFLIVAVFLLSACTIQLSPNEPRFDDLTRRVGILEATKADAARTAEALNSLSTEIDKRPMPTPVPTPQG